ncbi:uncharacterized protein N7506_008368 [Penicillium brevicompactum]|uniref:uncharacterized protein n=1 Tax=Penicillium brevicompactum TaxID=5074 RepID=UPI002540D245|nr:uncharacterized protein N7506_008368 [Penicillium brevicompactum]KAJ5325266.1 hypothetical protein N7506_008368 [Penicillium brevicompactum]
MNQKCPDLGIDCVNACECERSALYIDCAGTHCWNQVRNQIIKWSEHKLTNASQVYSCEYQDTVMDFVSSCTNPNREGLPYWPVPDDAPGSCSCNLGKIDLKESQISDHITQCANNETNLAQFSEVEDINNYGKACLCCAYSGIISAYIGLPYLHGNLSLQYHVHQLLTWFTSIWDTCPDTKPSLLSADEWFNQLLIPGDWDECGPYLEAYDCAGDLGYGRPENGGISKFWSPSSMPTNGTKTVSNIAGVISSPVSGDTFTWTFGRTTNALGATTSPVIHTVTVSSANAVVTDTKAKATGDSGSTATSTSSGSAASETKPGMGSALEVPRWTTSCIIVALVISAL